MKNGAFHFQRGAQFVGIGQIAIVRQCHMPFDMVYNDRLRVDAVVRSGCAVADVSDRHLPLAKRFEHFRCKNIVDKPGIFVRAEDAVVVDDNAAAFLTAVLKGEQPIIDCARQIGGIWRINAEYAAFFS